MWEWNSEHLEFVWTGDNWTFAIGPLSWGLPLAFSATLEFWSIKFLCFYVERRR